MLFHVVAANGAAHIDAAADQAVLIRALPKVGRIDVDVRLDGFQVVVLADFPGMAEQRDHGVFERLPGERKLLALGEPGLVFGGEGDVAGEELLEAGEVHVGHHEVDGGVVPGDELGGVGTPGG